MKLGYNQEEFCKKFDMDRREIRNESVYSILSSIRGFVYKEHV